jgi:hypothetical protein
MVSHKQASKPEEVEMFINLTKRDIDHPLRPVIVQSFFDYRQLKAIFTQIRHLMQLSLGENGELILLHALYSVFDYGEIRHIGGSTCSAMVFLLIGPFRYVESKVA